MKVFLEQIWAVYQPLASQLANFVDWMSCQELQSAFLQVLNAHCLSLKLVFDLFNEGFKNAFQLVIPLISHRKFGADKPGRF